MTPILPVMTAETLDGVLRGDQPHPAKVELSDQDLADLQAYLASLAGGGG
jgi:cytochrome c553